MGWSKRAMAWFMPLAVLSQVIGFLVLPDSRDPFSFLFLLVLLFAPALLYSWLRPPWWVGVTAGVLGFILGAVGLQGPLNAGTSSEMDRVGAPLVMAIAGGMMGEWAALLAVGLWRVRPRR